MMSKKPAVSQVVALLELTARFHPAGMGILLGLVQPPSVEEIADLVQSFSGTSDLGVRISGGVQIPEAERLISLTSTFTEIVEVIGGWEHIWRVVREVRGDISPDRWREASDFVAHITPGGYVRDGDGGMGARLFRTDGRGRHGICERTARRRFRNLMRVIAVKILSSPPGNEFQLLSSVSGGYPS